MPTTKEILKKYERKLEEDIGSSSTVDAEALSKEYSAFKGEMIPEIGSYEKWVKSLGNLISIKASEKDRAKIQPQLNIAHLDVTASQAITFSIIAMFAVFFGTLLMSVAIYLIRNSLNGLVLFAFLGFLASLFVFYYTYTLPKRLAAEWRLKSSSQMVPAVLYTVVYMKHTSNLERAVAFAAEHLEGPLAMDFRKIFYDVEVGKFSTIKQSLDYYLESWKDYAPEFIESFHLIESSLFEPTENRRVEILEKSLTVILDGIYEKMLKYSRDIRSPLTNVYMLGIVLPTLGLALIPLASTLLGGALQWQHVFVIFDVIVPFLVFYLVSEALLKRPGGYGDATVLELNPEYYKYKSNKPWITAALICIPILILGLLPFIFQINFITSSLGLQSDYTLGIFGLQSFSDIKLFDFQISDQGTTGPFGPFAVLLSLLIPVAIGLFFSIAYNLKTKDLIKSREDTKLLENEFTNSLFQLGNRLGDGVPAEIAFGRVAESTTSQKTHEFFATVNNNIQSLGLSLERAIFDKKRGAITYFPSPLISTSMKILVESVKKGLAVAARSLMSISEYVKNIEKINQRLKDLLAEVVSDMRSNMVFLAPLLAGIVVGLSTMITTILNKLQTIVALSSTTGSTAGLGNISSITDIFNLTQMIPPYYIQIAIGIYLIEIAFILTKALVTVDSGKDVLKEKYELAQNLKKSMLLYIVTALISIVALDVLAMIALSGLSA